MAEVTNLVPIVFWVFGQRGNDEIGNLLVSHVTKALQVVRKRQRMHDRKRFEGRHRALSISLSISFLSFSLAMRDYASREGDTKRIESLLR